MLRSPSGAQRFESFETRREAESAKRGIEAAISTEDHWTEVARLEVELDKARALAIRGGQARTVREVIEAYLEDKGSEIKANTVGSYRGRLTSFLAPVLDEPAVSISSQRALALYREYANRVGSVATHRKGLRQVRTVWAWASDEERRWVAQGVWDAVKPKGRTPKGKPQPRPSEAALIYSRAFELAELEDGTLDSIGGLALATQLLLGLRSSELVSAVGRDVEQGAWYVADSKTHNGVRAIEIPSRLRPLIERRAAVVGPEGRIFPYDRTWPLRRVKALCKELGIREYTAHALRGLHSTLAVQAGATSHAVARTLGHGSTAVTEAHYLAPGIRQRRESDERREFWETFSTGDVSHLERAPVASAKS